jgi:serine/threonine protein kinase/tetratricopeptide (TPR) repeat protein
MPILDRQPMGERFDEVADEGRAPNNGAVPSNNHHGDNGGTPTPAPRVEATGSSVSASLTGATVGHYQVGERLGGGAMAAVYRAHDQILNRDVAIKVLLPGADAVMQKRFRSEARMVSTLVHPHIVRTLQVGRSGGIIYIAMELIEGASLAELLERQGKLSPTDAGRILAPVAAALGYAHEQGIVHRDVKPSNILLQRVAPNTPHSVSIAALPYPVIPLLSDFGIARALDAPELTSAGRTIGTPAFMAPEQCAGSSDIDGRADVYALGAVLYRCLVGKAPFGGTTTQILHAHVYDDLLIPDIVADTLPPQAVNIIARAMMKEPAQRYERIEMMAAELRDVGELPQPAGDAAYAEMADATMTMTSLPVAQTPATSTSRVLVAAVRPTQSGQAARPNPLRTVPRTPGPTTTAMRTVTPAPPPRRTRSRRNQFSMFALMGAFAVLMLIAGMMFVNSVLPGLGSGGTEEGSGTPTPAAIAQNGTPVLPVVDPTLGPGGSTATPQVGAGVDQENRPTPEPTPTGPTPTPEPPLTSLQPTWDHALAAFEEGQWQDAREALNLILRSIERGLEYDEEEVDPARLREMLKISHVGLAADAATVGRWEQAITHVERAIEITPTVDIFVNMVDVFSELKDLSGPRELPNATDDTTQVKRRELYADLASLYEAYASRLSTQGYVCDAVTQANHAMQFSATDRLQEYLDELTAECEKQNATEAIVEVGGTIIYSTGGSGTPYSIWRLPVNSGGTATNSELIRSGSQPQLSPSGSALAFHSVGEGLHMIGMNHLLSAWGDPVRLSPNAEDGNVSPASWNPSGTRLVYSSQRGNEMPRIYMTTADANREVRDLGWGRDPAWSPDGTKIVFQGPNAQGQPGLRMVTEAGDWNDRRDLTDNGNDLRPVWTSDGKYIVFMCQDRFVSGTSWEVCRRDMSTGAEIQLTDGASTQEGLPAISPDNKWVAFVSDRGGTWNLYYVSIDGGPIHFLSAMSGQPISWLDHNVQWVD